jgi:hypothetical protein
MIGFVDDSYLCVNNFTSLVQSPDLLLEQATNCGMTSCRVREEPWKSRSVYHLAHYGCTEAGCPVLQPSKMTRHRFQFKKHVLPHPTPFNAYDHTQLGKPWDVAGVLHLTLSRVYNIYKPQAFASSLRGCKIRLPFLLLHLPPGCHILLPYHHHSGRASYHRTKRICLPHLV